MKETSTLINSVSSYIQWDKCKMAIAKYAMHNWRPNLKNHTLPTFYHWAMRATATTIGEKILNNIFVQWVIQLNDNLWNNIKVPTIEKFLVCHEISFFNPVILCVDSYSMCLLLLRAILDLVFHINIDCVTLEFVRDNKNLLEIVK